MYNKCTFVGRLGADPIVRTTENENKVAQFNIACDEPGHTTRDGKEVPKRTEWIPIVAWNGWAELVEKYAKKGSQVLVDGKFRSRSYDNKEGQKVYVTEIYAEFIRLLEPKRDAAPLPPGPGAATNNESSPAPQAPIGDKDDLPF